MNNANSHPSCRMRLLTRLGGFCICLGLVLNASAGQPAFHFYPDDPLERDPETQDASGVRPWKLSDDFDLVKNSLGTPGEQADRRALNVNTLDEVPDSSWFTNRLLRHSMSTGEQAQGPNQGTGPASGPWTIVEGKLEGIQPGFTLTDSRGQRFFVKFDPPSNPEMASGAEVISTKFFDAFGYHVPENSIGRIRREALVIGRGATVRRDGRTHKFTTRDLDAILERAARSSDGSYRLLASKELSGRPIGPFRYHGTRPDDPNDIYPHEHRRELRGMRVLAAWLNHHDVRSANSFDTVLEVNGRKLVRHYLLDFGATLGSGSIEAQKRRAGHEYLWEARPALITMLTLGLYVQPWLKIDYPDIPAVGRIEADYLRPEDWKPDYPNPAFLNAREDDTFWAALRIAAFSDEIIRAIVKTAEFTDQSAEDYLTQVLIKRRDKVLRHWLTDVNPLVDFTLTTSGALAFRNAAVDARVSSPATEYRVRWTRFDNASGSSQAAAAEGTSATPTLQVPADLLSNAEFVLAEVAATHAEHAAWARPVSVYFRRDGNSWKTVGVERLPDTRDAAATSSSK